MKHKIQFSLIFFILISAVSVSWAGNERDPYKHFFDETWGDLPEELKKAKIVEKKRFLYSLKWMNALFAIT